MFSVTLLKLLPLFSYSILGWVAGKTIRLSRDDIAKLLIYFIAPIVIFSGVASAELHPETLALPLIFFLLCSAIGLFHYFVIKKYVFPRKTEAHILGFAIGSGNTGYFGIPVATALFGSEALPYVILCALGFILFENTVGFYLVARGHFSARESIHRLLRVPTLYAFALGVIFNHASFLNFEGVQNIFSSMQGAYSVLGMMIIGLGLSELTINSFDLKFVSTALFGKVLLWPIVTAFTILGLKKVFPSFAADEFKTQIQIMQLMSIMPLPANSVAFASLLKIHPEKMAVAVLINTALSAIMIPVVISYFFN